MESQRVVRRGANRKFLGLLCQLNLRQYDQTLSTTPTNFARSLQQNCYLAVATHQHSLPIDLQETQLFRIAHHM